MFATPQWWAPDEAAQYLRAVTISQGHLVGPHVPIDPAGLAALAAGGWQATQERWLLHDRRGVVVGARLAPPGELCVDGRPDVGSCEEASYTGDYFPPGYLLPAAAISTQSTAGDALWSARAASLVQTLLFIAFAIALIGPGAALLGLLLAMPPEVLFIGSVLNPSGVEISASVAFLAGLLRLCRQPGGRERWVWAVTVLSGVVAIVSWQLGPLFVGCDLVVAAALFRGWKEHNPILRAGPRFLAAASLLLAATAAFLIYGELSGALHSIISFRDPGADLSSGLAQLGPTLRGAVGNFGFYDIPLPPAMSNAWLAVAAGLWLMALWVGARRERATLLLAALLALGAPVALYAFAQRNTDFGLQGRYGLPLFALIPIVAGVVIQNNVGSRPAAFVTRFAPLLAVGCALFQVGAWWVNAHHWAGGALIFQHARMVPPGGWWLWAGCALAGGAVLATSSLIEFGRREREGVDAAIAGESPKTERAG